MNNNSFVLYTNYFDIINDLTNEDAGLLFKAILKYKTTGDYELPPHLSLAFKFIKNQLDIDSEKYNKKCEKAKKNGSLGGRPKQEKNQKNLTVLEKPNGYFQNHNDNENDNDNDNENDNDFLKEKEKEKISFLINREEFKKTDPFSNPLLDDYFSTYKQNCTNLCKLGFEPRNRETRELLSAFIDEIDNDVGYFNSLCLKANELKTICNKQIDFKSLLRNHIGIMNGKYKEKTAMETTMDEVEEWFRSRESEKEK